MFCQRYSEICLAMKAIDYVSLSLLLFVVTSCAKHNSHFLRVFSKELLQLLHTTLPTVLTKPCIRQLQYEQASTNT